MTMEVSFLYRCDGKGNDPETGVHLCPSTVPSGPWQGVNTDAEPDDSGDYDGGGEPEQYPDARLPGDWLRIVHHRAELYSGNATHRGYYEHTRTLHICPSCAAPLLALLPDPFRKSDER